MGDVKNQVVEIVAVACIVPPDQTFSQRKKSVLVPYRWFQMSNIPISIFQCMYLDLYHLYHKQDTERAGQSV